MEENSIELLYTQIPTGKGDYMGFEEVKKEKIKKLSELYNGKHIEGVYKGFSMGKFSKIHNFLYDGDTEIEIYGCVSLDALLTDQLIESLLKVECVELVDVGKEHPKAIAKVQVWHTEGVPSGHYSS